MSYDQETIDSIVGPGQQGKSFEELPEHAQARVEKITSDRESQRAKIEERERIMALDPEDQAEARSEGKREVLERNRAEFEAEAAKTKKKGA